MPQSNDLSRSLIEASPIGFGAGKNEKWWIMGRSPDQFGPEGPEVSTAAACRSPAGNYMARPKRGFVPGGTNSSNPSPSSGESANHRFLSRGETVVCLPRNRWFESTLAKRRV